MADRLQGTRTTSPASKTRQNVTASLSLDSLFLESPTRGLTNVVLRVYGSRLGAHATEGFGDADRWLLLRSRAKTRARSSRGHVPLTVAGIHSFQLGIRPNPFNTCTPLFTPLPPTVTLTHVTLDPPLYVFPLHYPTPTCHRSWWTCPDSVLYSTQTMSCIHLARFRSHRSHYHCCCTGVSHSTINE